MMKKRLYDLAYQFRKSKIWKKMREDELFAVELDGGDVGYCIVMGSGGEHVALAVYPGALALSSLRRIKDGFEMDSDAPFLQDSVQCCLEEKDELPPEEVDEIRSYCKTYGAPFRSPLPTFLRVSPCRLLSFPREEKDWKTIETALSVLVKIAEVIDKKGTRGKDELGLIPIDLGVDGESYALDGVQNAATEGETTIPLFSVVDGRLQSKRVALPPYQDLFATPPTRFDDDAIARLKQMKQKGVYECEARRLPDALVEDQTDPDNPPYMPTFLFLVGGDKKRNPASSASNVPMYDPNVMLSDFVNYLLQEGVYPTKIKVRTEETKTLLEEFCRRANIRLEIASRLKKLDETCERLTENLASHNSVLDLIISVTRDSSVNEIRQLPSGLLDEIRFALEKPEIADQLPEDVAVKLMLAGL